jgi:hypothetical protein
VFDILPLDPEKYDRIDQEATKPEWVWRRVPIVGWMISTILWELRNRPLFDDYCSVLNDRQKIDLGIWGSERCQEIASSLCRAAKSEIGWPNDHFIPSDPIRIALWSFHDGLDAEEAIMRVGDDLQLDIKWKELIPIWNSELSHLVDYIATLPICDQTV